jgi:hypothetical protein
MFERAGADFTTNVRDRPNAGNFGPWRLTFTSGGAPLEPRLNTETLLLLS